MAVLFADLQISNPLKEEKGKKMVRCVVNRSLFSDLMINQKIADDLGLEEVEKRKLKIGDGSAEIYSYVGPVKLEFKNRIGFVGAVIIKSEDASCCLGSIVMDEMDLIVVSEGGIRLDINPNSAVLA